MCNTSCGNGTFQSQKIFSIESYSHLQYINSGYFNEEDHFIDLVFIDSINGRIHIVLGSDNISRGNKQTSVLLLHLDTSSYFSALLRTSRYFSVLLHKLKFFTFKSNAD